MQKSVLILDEKILRDNYKKIVGRAGQTVCVLKADAYAHGDKAVFSALIKEGAKSFAVANVKEGARLKTYAKEQGADIDVYILGHVGIGDLQPAKEYSLIVPIVSKEYLFSICDKKDLPALYLQIDTGMNRLGVDYRDEDIPALMRLIKTVAKNGFYGVWSHLFDCADAARSYLQAQRLKGVCGREAVSLSASGALDKNYFSGEKKRVGLSLYGYGDFATKNGLLPPLSLKTFLVRAKKVYAGETVGYAPPYQVKKDCYIGTIPIGYADGVMRGYVGGKVFLRGGSCEIVAVCMDAAMIKLDFPAKAGDEVTVFSAERNLLSLTAKCGTIVYEGLTALGNRLERVTKIENVPKSY